MRTTALLLSAVALAATCCAAGATTNTLAPGPRASLVAFVADPLADIHATQRAAFVMKDGGAVAP